MRKVKIKKCPACKSANITLYMGGYFGKYLCKDCGLVTSIVLEEDIEYKKENFKKKKI